MERKNSIAIVRTFAYNKDRWKHYSRKEMFYMATKSANLYARIEPDVKEKAEVQRPEGFLCDLYL